ncbi:MAG: hypothetical protein AAB680_02235 [Pseudomonadota bacterium]
MSNKYQIPDLEKKKFDWQFVFVGTAILFVMFIISFFANIGGTRNYLCTRAWFQPICAATNLSILSFSREDVAWYEASEAKSCTGIEQYLAKYPNGKNAQVAAARLSGRKLVEHADWEEKQAEVDIHYTRFLNQYLVKTGPARNFASAKHDAIENAKAQAREVECEQYSSGNFKLNSVRIKPQTWNCSGEGDGQFCDFDGSVICYYSEKLISVGDEC